MSPDEPKYVFVDKTGRCFEDFQATKNCSECFNNHECDDCFLRAYNDAVGAMMRVGKNFGVGDMMVFKQDLLDAGFVWGKDFYVRKIDVQPD